MDTSDWPSDEEGARCGSSGARGLELPARAWRGRGGVRLTDTARGTVGGCLPRARRSNETRGAARRWAPLPPTGV
eukprot:5343935-Alexandrium_andersonii.AAC.1